MGLFSGPSGPDAYSRAYELFAEEACARLRARDPTFDPARLESLGTRLWDSFTREWFEDAAFAEPAGSRVAILEAAARRFNLTADRVAPLLARAPPAA